jgi:drug/metabolite transporter (DMT)-like permease
VTFSLSRLSARIPTRHKGAVFVAMAALLWSTSGIFIKALPLGAFQILFYRSLVAALAIALALRVRREPWSVAPDASTAACVATYAAVLILFVTSTKLTTAANAIFLQFSAPIYLLFLEPWLLKRPFHQRDLWAVGACMGGMALFFAGHLERGGLFGNLLGMGSGLCLAFWALLLKARRERHPGRSPIGTVILGNLLVAAIALPVIFPHLAVTARQGASLLYLGVFQLGFSYMLFTAGMKYLTATAAMITSMLEAVFNPVWVFLGVGERPSPYAILGGLVILAVIACYNLRQGSEVAQVG